MATTKAPSEREKLVVFSSGELRRTIERLACQIVEPTGAGAHLVLIGIRKGGENLTRRIAAEIKRATGSAPAVGFLNINLYRDDDASREMPESEIAEDVTGKEVVIVDDVLYTGRTVRSALDAITDLGRPQSVRLCALIDRGQREFPIQADYVGKSIPTTRSERVVVELRPEPDVSDRVVICEPV
ncbi:MAG TPA: bifunctional pyr operon transcriptional regulator/uracil phosphoribosyltransferase PyrR [Candidatus Eremiobacteraceae bacterium]|nr:bifunctional pyr operon transcriptional regulator/uracil phosphoribosyltransferase PyrR [Candidatus Eremiobacteraceae bacterium]